MSFAAPPALPRQSQSQSGLQPTAAAVSMRSSTSTGYGAKSANPSSASTSTSASTSRAHLMKSKPLLQSLGPLHIPIPPTLQNSPYLQSPDSVFRRQYSAKGTPGEEEEKWLRDTVPISGTAPAASSQALAHVSGGGKTDQSGTRTAQSVTTGGRDRQASSVTWGDAAPQSGADASSRKASSHRDGMSNEAASHNTHSSSRR